jgi:diguanylate cyclase (GGDEF)-like protein/PAS domain S-box-containing protein
VLETVDVAVIACDADGELTFFNRAAREFHGQQPSKLDAGQWAEHYDLYEADGKTRLAPFEIPLLRALAGESVKNARIVIAPRGMARRTVLASGRRLLSPTGERLGAVVALKDISDLNNWQDKLRSSEQMLRTIAENLPTMICQVDRDGRFVFLNSRSLKVYGQPAEKLIGRPVRGAYTDSEYAQIAPHIDAAAAGSKSSFEGQILVHGKQLHFHAAFVPHFDDKGGPDGYFAMAFDITTRRESELLQLQSEERLRTITDNVPVLISYLDSEFRFQFANAMYQDWLGHLSADMLGRTVEAVFGASYFEERKPGLLQALGGNMSTIEVKVHRKDRERILSTTYIPHFRAGKVVGIYVLATDATAARAHERQLLALANEDPLTKLPNRRMYEYHLGKTMAMARRQGTALALAYLDLDNFKKINDTLGHGAGDEVLIEFGKRVKSVLRESDMLARLAGDEFTVVLEAVGSVEHCEAIAAKILDVLKKPFVVCGQLLQISASIGVAMGGAGATPDALAHEADAALYSSKRNGKGRFCVIELAARAGSVSAVFAAGQGASGAS